MGEDLCRRPSTGRQLGRRAIGLALVPRRTSAISIVTWSFSNAPFAIALPSERTEAVL
jgi:hypothetical protein